MKTLTQIEAREFAQSLIANGAVINWYAKFARITARPGIVGEEIVTNTSEGIETKNTIEEEGDMVVTNPDGEEYIIKSAIFTKRYEATEVPGVYKPKGGPQQFIQIEEPISFIAPWGQEMNIAADGYLNVTNPDDLYGIQPQEFAETYALCDEAGNFLN